jgi:glycosyltransferase involved in cell wall biosynthesis
MGAAGESIRLSVALVTRNRPGLLRQCLESLRAQNVQPGEVVVSDDSEVAFVEQTREVAVELGCRYVEGPRRGLYANRNFAALQCAGTHVRTMDHDHTFPPGHFAQCLAAVREDPQAIWTTGETTYIDGGIYYKAERAAQLHPSGVACPVSDPDDNWAIADGSTIYPAKLFGQGARMVEDYNYGSSYLEFGAYAYALGFHSRCVPGAAVEHHADKAMLERARDPGVIESLLYASLSYNLCFRPSLFSAIKYALAHLRDSGFSPGLLGRIPALAAKARGRWAAATRQVKA